MLIVKVIYTSLVGAVMQENSDFRLMYAACEKLFQGKTTIFSEMQCKAHATHFTKAFLGKKRVWPLDWSIHSPNLSLSSKPEFLARVVRQKSNIAKW